MTSGLNRSRFMHMLEIPKDTPDEYADMIIAAYKRGLRWGEKTGRREGYQNARNKIASDLRDILGINNEEPEDGV